MQTIDFLKLSQAGVMFEIFRGTGWTQAHSRTVSFFLLRSSETSTARPTEKMVLIPEMI